MKTLDLDWDKRLKIRTCGRDDSHSDQYRYPYEPTPYAVLERLVRSGYLERNNTVLDYGCGKGRVEFFLSRHVGCRCIGVEYDDRIYQAACANLRKAANTNRIEFVHMSAEKYQVSPEIDRFYFFNPFSLEILQKVIGRIREAEEGKSRLLFFYYPSDEYVSYLMTVDELMFADEIDCRDLFDGNNSRERILIFEG